MLKEVRDEKSAYLSQTSEVVYLSNVHDSGNTIQSIKISSEKEREDCIQSRNLLMLKGKSKRGDTLKK